MLCLLNISLPQLSYERRTIDLVEHGEDFNLRFHLFRNGLDDEIGVASGLIDGAGISDARKSGAGVGAATLPSSIAASRLARISVSSFAQRIGQKGLRE